MSIGAAAAVSGLDPLMGRLHLADGELSKEAIHEQIRTMDPIIERLSHHRNMVMLKKLDDQGRDWREYRVVCIRGDSTRMAVICSEGLAVTVLQMEVSARGELSIQLNKKELSEQEIRENSAVLRDLLEKFEMAHRGVERPDFFKADLSNRIRALCRTLIQMPHIESLSSGDERERYTVGCHSESLTELHLLIQAHRKPPGDEAAARVLQDSCLFIVHKGEEDLIRLNEEPITHEKIHERREVLGGLVRGAERVIEQHKTMG